MGEIKKYREFTVTPGICGFKVKIGCTEAYFGDVSQLSEAIRRYLVDPAGTEAEYSKADLRNGMVGLNRPAGPIETNPSGGESGQETTAPPSELGLGRARRI